MQLEVPSFPEFEQGWPWPDDTKWESHKHGPRSSILDTEDAHSVQGVDTDEDEMPDSGLQSPMLISSCSSRHSSMREHDTETDS